MTMIEPRCSCGWPMLRTVAEQAEHALRHHVVACRETWFARLERAADEAERLLVARGAR